MINGFVIHKKKKHNKKIIRKAEKLHVDEIENTEMIKGETKLASFCFFYSEYRKDKEISHKKIFKKRHLFRLIDQ